MYEPYHQDERDDCATIGCLLIVAAFIITLALFILLVFLSTTGGI